MLRALLLLLLPALCFGAGIPREAAQYQRALTANARALWGMDAPVATFAGQIHQESGWRKDAKSPFANGLAQFTPDTADWIGGLYPDLADRQPFNPTWAIRALVRYDRLLWEKYDAAPPCDRMAFTLSAYNGGAGTLRKEQDTARLAGASPGRWFGHVERFCRRNAAACEENRAYPRRILMRHQQLYAGWGRQTDCRGVRI